MNNPSRQSSCLCSRHKQLFSPRITFYNKAVFPDYEGAVIGECQRCKLYKTIIKPRNFNAQSSRPQMYEANKTQLIKEFQPIIATIANYMNKGAILDVGASSGILVDELCKRGYDAWGIEPNRQAHQSAQNKKTIPVFHGNLARFQKKHPKKHFSVVVYNHVLEHVKDPILELSLIKKILHKRGLLIIGVPNRRNVVFLVRTTFWESLMPTEHLWHFTDRYLTNIIKQNGFEIKNTFYANHSRKQLSFAKRIYFYFLTLLNTLLKTGEAVTIVSQMR